MMEKIEISIPYEPNALRHAAGMLNNMAESLPAESTRVPDVVKESQLQNARIEAILGAFIKGGHAGDTVGYATGPHGVEIGSRVADYDTGREDGRAEMAEAVEAASTASEPAEEQTAAQVFEQKKPEPETPPAPNGVELDSAGLPWDVRINPESRAKLKKTGEWKLRRNMDPAFVEEVRAELRAAMSAGVPAASAGPVEAEPTPTANVEESPKMPPPPPKEDSASEDIPQDFTGMILRITSDELSQEFVLATIQEFGFADLGTVATRPDLVPEISKRLFGG